MPRNAMRARRQAATDAIDEATTNGLALVSGRFWAITDDGWRTLLHAAQSSMPAAKAYASRAERTGYALSTTVRDGVATIPVYGPLAREANFMSWWLGWSTYEEIVNDLHAAQADANVRKIVLDYNTPGGDVFGCSDCAAAIRASTAIKPTESYVSGAACSAGYWLTSAGGRVVVASVGMVGCLGTQIKCLDTSRYDVMMGFEEITIISSQTPKKNLDPAKPEGRAEAQQIADDLADVFINSVAEYMNVSRETVLNDFGQGGVFVGERAVAAGMAHEVGTFDLMLSDVPAENADISVLIPAPGSSARAASSSTGVDMKKENPAPAANAAPATDPPAGDPATPVESPAAPEKKHDEQPPVDAQAKAIADAKAAEKDRQQKIRALKGTPEQIQAAIDDDLTPEAAAYRILTAQNGEAAPSPNRLAALRQDDAGTHPTAAPPAPPLNASAQILADFKLLNPSRSN